MSKCFCCWLDIGFKSQWICFDLHLFFAVVSMNRWRGSDWCFIATWTCCADDSKGELKAGLSIQPCSPCFPLHSSCWEGLLVCIIHFQLFPGRKEEIFRKDSTGCKEKKRSQEPLVIKPPYKKAFNVNCYISTLSLILLILMYALSRQFDSFWFYIF